MNDDLAELQESARRVLGGSGLAAAEEKTWPLLVELGWLLASVPEPLGGLGQGAPGLCVLLAEMGRRLAAVPCLPAMLAIDAVCQSELTDRESWVERLTAGDYVAVPLAESSICLERASSGKSRLTGLASAVQSADRASHALIWTSDADCVALVPLGEPGVEISERPTWDTTRRMFDLRFTGTDLDARHVLAQGPAARIVSRRIATLRDFALAADSLGGAAALLELTVEHLQTRRQFGRPLALFQALKHRCADLKTITSAAEALLFDSLGRLGEQIGDAEAETKGKTAKYLACSAYSRVAEEALQLHGGIGMASEHPCHLFLKRALLNEQLGRREDCYELEIADRLLAGSS
jgi:alkylation response protein AidB-like acyl-CoA dehydrogenase